jgi:uncharacterized membrane protein
MPQAENEVTINRPVDEVFEFVADGETAPQWRSAVLDVEHVGGEGVGAKYRQGVKGPFGKRVPADYEITAYEQGRLLAFRATDGPVRPEGRYEFSGDGLTTRVKFSLAADLNGPTRLMGPMVGKAMRGEVQNLERLREVLEGGASASTRTS